MMYDLPTDEPWPRFMTKGSQLNVRLKRWNASVKCRTKLDANELVPLMFEEITTLQARIKELENEIEGMYEDAAGASI